MPGRAASRAQRPDRFHRTGTALRLACRRAGVGGAGRSDGVHGVGLAVAAPQLAVGAVHLHDRYILGVQVAGQAGPVGAQPT